MRYLYSTLYYALFPVILLRMLLRSRWAPAYRQRLAERFGMFPPDPARDGPAIWLHAVSVGEVLAAAPLVEDLLRDYPGQPLVITTTTPTGSERVRALFGQRVCHVYCPWDLPGSVRRFLQRVRPRLLIVMETELWPNLIHYTAATGCRILLANARLSERSARGYARIGSLTRGMLGKVDAVACQSPADGERFLSLGLPGSALWVMGNIKFDRSIDRVMRAEAATLRREFAADQRPVLVAASTHAGEEGKILAAFARLRRVAPECLLVLAPRHPERFQAVYDLARRDWQVSRRSQCDHPAPGDAIFICDTVGELALILSVATIALLGGSLMRRGGQNPLEAAAWEVPVVAGPHMYNFAQVSRLLVDAGAMIMLEEPEQLDSVLLELLQQPERCRAMGQAAGRVLTENRGAKTYLLALIERLWARD